MRGLYTWGQAWYGSLANGDGSGSAVLVPYAQRRLDAVGDVRPVGGSDIPAHGFTRTLTEQPKGWGWDAHHQVLPTGNYADSAFDNERSVPTPTTAITQVAANDMSLGGNHTLLANGSGHLYSWGNNDHGQCGQDHVAHPNAIGGRIGDTDFGAFFAVLGGKHASFALRTGATDPGLYGWGSDWGGDFPTLMSVQPPGLVGLAKAGGACETFFAVGGDGSLWGWGLGSGGALGTGGTSDAAAPTFLMSGVQQVSNAYDHTNILKLDGSVWAFGQGVDASGDQSNSPFELPTPPALVADMTAYVGGVLIVCADGTVWGRGYNASGQLGQGTVGGFFPDWVRVQADPGGGGGPLYLADATRIAASWDAIFCIADVAAAAEDMVWVSSQLG